MPIGNEILALGTWNFFKDTDHKQSYKFWMKFCSGLQVKSYKYCDVVKLWGYARQI
jgi:hypothetical protein